MPTPLELLDASQAILQPAVDGAAGRLDEQPPCEDYTVRQVIRHTIATIDSSSSSLDGGPATFPEIIAAEDRTAGEERPHRSCTVGHR